MAINCLSAIAVLVYIASACTSGDDSATCLASQSNSVKDVVEEIEDVNDSDMIMHLQMRANVDVVAEETAEPSTGDLQERQQLHSEPVKAPLQKAVPLQQPATLTKHQEAIAMPQSFTDKDVVIAFRGSEVIPLLQIYTQALPIYQCLTVLAILVICFALCKLMNIVEKTVIRDRHAREDGFDASAKLQQMLKALRFEPPKEDESPPWSKEMQHVMAALPVAIAEPSPESEVDSKDSEEPETEPVEPEPEAAVEAIAFSEMAKQRGRDVCQQLASEGQRFALEGQKFATEAFEKLTPRSAERQNQIGLKVKVITC